MSIKEKRAAFKLSLRDASAMFDSAEFIENNVEKVQDDPNLLAEFREQASFLADDVIRLLESLEHNGLIE